MLPAGVLAVRDAACRAAMRAMFAADDAMPCRATPLPPLRLFRRCRCLSRYRFATPSPPRHYVATIRHLIFLRCYAPPQFD